MLKDNEKLTEESFKKLNRTNVLQNILGKQNEKSYMARRKRNVDLATILKTIGKKRKGSVTMDIDVNDFAEIPLGSNEQTIMQFLTTKFDIVKFFFKKYSHTRIFSDVGQSVYFESNLISTDKLFWKFILYAKTQIIRINTFTIISNPSVRQVTFKIYDNMNRTDFISFRQLDTYPHIFAGMKESKFSTILNNDKNYEKETIGIVYQRSPGNNDFIPILDIGVTVAPKQDSKNQRLYNVFYFPEKDFALVEFNQKFNTGADTKDEFRNFKTKVGGFIDQNNLKEELERNRNDLILQCKEKINEMIIVSDGKSSSVHTLGKYLETIMKDYAGSKTGIKKTLYSFGGNSDLSDLFPNTVYFSSGIVPIQAYVKYDFKDIDILNILFSKWVNDNNYKPYIKGLWNCITLDNYDKIIEFSRICYMITDEKQEFYQKKATKIALFALIQHYDENNLLFNNAQKIYSVSRRLLKDICNIFNGSHINTGSFMKFKRTLQVYKDSLYFFGNVEKASKRLKEFGHEIQKLLKTLPFYFEYIDQFMYNFLVFFDFQEIQDISEKIYATFSSVNGFLTAYHGKDLKAWIEDLKHIANTFQIYTLFGEHPCFVMDDPVNEFLGSILTLGSDEIVSSFITRSSTLYKQEKTEDEKINGIFNYLTNALTSLGKQKQFTKDDLTQLKMSIKAQYDENKAKENERIAKAIAKRRLEGKHGLSWAMQHVKDYKENRDLIDKKLAQDKNVYENLFNPENKDKEEPIVPQKKSIFASEEEQIIDLNEDTKSIKTETIQTENIQQNIISDLSNNKYKFNSNDEAYLKYNELLSQLSNPATKVDREFELQIGAAANQINKIQELSEKLKNFKKSNPNNYTGTALNQRGAFQGKKLIKDIKKANKEQEKKEKKEVGVPSQSQVTTNVAEKMDTSPE